MDGDESLSFFSIFFYSILLLIFGSGAKKAVQETKTIVERIIANKTFLVSI